MHTVNLQNEHFNPTHFKAVNQNCPLFHLQLHPSWRAGQLHSSTVSKNNSAWNPIPYATKDADDMQTRKFLGCFAHSSYVNRAWPRQLHFCEYTHRPHCLPSFLNILMGSSANSNKWALQMMTPSYRLSTTALVPLASVRMLNNKDGPSEGVPGQWTKLKILLLLILYIHFRALKPMAVQFTVWSFCVKKKYIKILHTTQTYSKKYKKYSLISNI